MPPRNLCVTVKVSRWRYCAAWIGLRLYRAACAISRHRPGNAEVSGLKAALVRLMAPGVRVGRVRLQR